MKAAQSTKNQRHPGPGSDPEDPIDCLLDKGFGQPRNFTDASPAASGQWSAALGQAWESKGEPDILYLRQSGAPDQGRTLAPGQSGGYYKVPHATSASRPANSVNPWASASRNASGNKEIFQVNCNLCSWKSKASTQAAAFSGIVLE